MILNWRIGFPEGEYPKEWRQRWQFHIGINRNCFDSEYVFVISVWITIPIWHVKFVNYFHFPKFGSDNE